MEETKKIPKVEIVRNQRLEDDIIKDDYLVIRYFPDEKEKYDYETMMIATKNLKGFIQALNAKSEEINFRDF